MLSHLVEEGDGICDFAMRWLPVGLEFGDFFPTNEARQASKCDRNSWFSGLLRGPFFSLVGAEKPALASFCARCVPVGSKMNPFGKAPF